MHFLTLFLLTIALAGSAIASAAVCEKSHADYKCACGKKCKCGK